MGNSVGFWRSCTGCTEGEDGYVNPRDYPDHPKHSGVPQGGGCEECRGRGVVFHPFTKADAEAIRAIGLTTYLTLRDLAP